MKFTTLLYLFILLLPALLLAQNRQLLHGRLVADSLLVDNVSVNNITARTVAVTNNKGSFTIQARAKDTLLFSSITFHSVYRVLKDEDLLQNPLVIKVDLNVTVLDEVVVSNLSNILKPSKEKNIVSEKSLKYDTPQLNKQVIENQVAKNGQGIDIIGVVKLFSRKRKGIKRDTEEYRAQKVFAVKVRNLYSDTFFTKTLKIPESDVDSFLHFCDTGANVQHLLIPQNELDLITYLTNKSTEYLKNKS